MGSRETPSGTGCEKFRAHLLEEWLEEASSKHPLVKLEIIPGEMEIAIPSKLGERVAELRDAIKLLKTPDTAVWQSAYLGAFVSNAIAV